MEIHLCSPFVKMKGFGDWNYRPISKLLPKEFLETNKIFYCTNLHLGDQTVCTVCWFLLSILNYIKSCASGLHTLTACVFHLYKSLIINKMLLSIFTLTIQLSIAHLLQWYRHLNFSSVRLMFSSLT